jgi:hypothetical protein
MEHEILFEKGNVKAYIKMDEDPSNPREWDNFGHIVAVHGRYNLGDVGQAINSENFQGWDEIEAFLRKERGADIMFPLYLYDHSGLRLKVGSFQGLLSQGHAEFDSGQIGFIYATKAEIKAEYKGNKIKALKRLEGVVETYDAYLSGRVYAAVIERFGEVIECVGGYFDYESAKADLKSMFEAELKVPSKVKCSKCGREHTEVEAR